MRIQLPASAMSIDATLPASSSCRPPWSTRTSLVQWPSSDGTGAVRTKLSCFSSSMILCAAAGGVLRSTSFNALTAREYFTRRPLFSRRRCPTSGAGLRIAEACASPLAPYGLDEGSKREPVIVVTPGDDLGVERLLLSRVRVRSGGLLSSTRGVRDSVLATSMRWSPS